MQPQVWRAGVRSERRRRARLCRGRSNQCNNAEWPSRDTSSSAQAGHSNRTRRGTTRRTCWCLQEWSADADRAGWAGRQPNSEQRLSRQSLQGAPFLAVSLQEVDLVVHLTAISARDRVERQISTRRNRLFSFCSRSQMNRGGPSLK